MNINAPLSVITGAYNRLARPARDPQHITSELTLQAARQYAANAQNMALRSPNLCNPGSGTALPPDALFAIYQRNEPQSQTILNLIFAFTGQNETNDVIADAFLESYEKFSNLFELTCVKAKRDSSPDSTAQFAAMYRAAGDSTTATQPIEDRYSWVKHVYELVHLGQTSKALRTIYSAVEGHFKRQDLVGLALVLAEVDLKRLNPATMTGLLRISGRAKGALPVWHELLARVRIELARLNVPDLPGLLVGLGS